MAIERAGKTKSAAFEEPNRFKGALNDRVYDYIVHQIIVGAFDVNARLPTEMQLAESLSVSRPVVRQALRRLKDDGLVISHQGVGNFVVQKPGRQVSELHDEGSVADIQKCFIFRIALESEAAAIAAVEQDEAALTALSRALKSLQLSLENDSDAASHDIAFHQAIAQGTSNRFFVDAMGTIAREVRVGVRLNHSLTRTQSTSRREAVFLEHEAVYNAIVNRDSLQAKLAMKHHLESARRRVFQDI